MDSVQSVSAPPSPRPAQASFVVAATLPRLHWYPTVRRFTHNQGAGFVATARRALVKATKQTRLKKGSRKQVCQTTTNLRNELTPDAIRLEDGNNDDGVLLETSSTDFNKLLDPLLFSLQPFQGSSTVVVNDSTQVSDSTSSKTSTLKEPVLASQVPLNPLLQAAITSKGPLDPETQNLITTKLAEMKEARRQGDEHSSKIGEYVADDFCGCTSDEFWNWHESLSSARDSKYESSDATMRLLLRAFFDTQFIMFDELVYLEKRGLTSVYNELEEERQGSARKFLAEAGKNFELALWTYFVTECPN